MSNPTRYATIAMCALFLSGVLPAQSGRAEVITEIRGEYQALTILLGFRVPADPPGVEFFYAVDGTVSGTTPPEPALTGFQLSSLGVNIRPFSDTNSEARLFDPLDPDPFNPVVPDPPLRIVDPADPQVFAEFTLDNPYLLINEDFGPRTGTIFGGAALTDVAPNFPADLSAYLPGAVFEIRFRETTFIPTEDGRAIFPVQASATFQLSPIPEPASLTLCFIGAAGMGILGLCRRLFPGKGGVRRRLCR